MTEARKKAFQKKIRDYYRKHKRVLPWRETKNPYRILVSEIMLQQTQVDRVIPKYEAWLKQFPTMQKLSQASLHDVLSAWQGLGYNRRAKALHDIAKIIIKEHKGVFPKSIEQLESLPGIGPYTARAIATFVFDQQHIFIETNIRTVFIHEFFKNKKEIDDKEILKLIEQTLPQRNIRDWYYALMDYGTMLKKGQGNANRRSKHYTKQSKFEGSRRQLRGKIIKALTQKPITKIALKNQLEDDRFDDVLKTLIKEGIIRQNKTKLYI